MKPLWKAERGLTIREMVIDTFLFSFSHDVERNRVLDDEPWHFDNARLVLKVVDSEADLGWGEFYFSNSKGMKNEIGGILGNVARSCVKVDTEANGEVFWQFPSSSCQDRHHQITPQGSKYLLGMKLASSLD
ncbi:hypothetical protein PanWU01x14_285220 [Parasponia andersonii]|uniref:DUF4283 domain-containing protein n=1 Tax=Parasponia andersonii TaxID=3476 RepID=A0A2P5AZK0_PARAD|nr:hypothetical protein PanWU01x14_285220 [Parasponia andersonii]